MKPLALVIAYDDGRHITYQKKERRQSPADFGGGICSSLALPSPAKSAPFPLKSLSSSVIRMSLLSKRKKPEPKPAGGLVEIDRRVLEVIKSKKEMAIWTKDLKTETNMSDAIINKSIKNLLNSSLIKEVVHAQQKGKKHYIAAEFEPSTEITGGSWYVNGDLDIVFIDQLKDICLRIIGKLKVATADGVYDFFKTRNLVNTDCTRQQISEILRSMVLDNMIIDVKSTGLGEYHSIPVGKLCYRCPPGGHSQGPKTGALTLIPCGICPRIRQCTPDGLISPTTCVYYNKCDCDYTTRRYDEQQSITTTNGSIF